MVPSGETSTPVTGNPDASTALTARCTSESLNAAARVTGIAPLEFATPKSEAV